MVFFKDGQIPQRVKIVEFKRGDLNLLGEKGISKI